MKEYEMVWEIFNQCSGNQMRDVFFEEVELDDLRAYVEGRYENKDVQIDEVKLPDGTIVFDVVSAGMKQRYTFSEI